MLKLLETMAGDKKAMMDNPKQILGNQRVIIRERRELGSRAGSPAWRRTGTPIRTGSGCCRPRALRRSGGHARHGAVPSDRSWKNYGTTRCWTRCPGSAAWPGAGLGVLAALKPVPMPSAPCHRPADAIRGPAQAGNLGRNDFACRIANRLVTLL